MWNSFVFIFFGVLPLTKSVFSESKDSTNYKVLSSSNKSFSIANVEAYIDEGENFVKIGDFEKAKDSFKKARNLSKKLAVFYLSVSKNLFQLKLKNI